jgi:hypothetical protein
MYGRKQTLLKHEGRGNLVCLDKSKKLKLVFECECGPDPSASG